VAGIANRSRAWGADSTSEGVADASAAARESNAADRTVRRRVDEVGLNMGGSIPEEGSDG
jgi:hypothetical protein